LNYGLPPDRDVLRAHGHPRAQRTPLLPEREFFVGNLLVRIHFIIVMIRWTGLAPWKFEFPCPGSLTSTFLVAEAVPADRDVLWASASSMYPSPPSPISSELDTYKNRFQKGVRMKESRPAGCANGAIASLWKCASRGRVRQGVLSKLSRPAGGGHDPRDRAGQRAADPGSARGLLPPFRRRDPGTRNPDPENRNPDPGRLRCSITCCSRHHVPNQSAF